ncbi:MAG: FtsW/RodA/SpoVE family cell cycle protein, partial [Eggerthellaceae bacterium]|nr:FtsW/RodA/SpoVE family cell cycle protein [Eggerthellaceae bacterium]
FVFDELLRLITGNYHLIKEYQRARLSVFADQGASDASGTGYNLKQAMIAIGSGGFLGKGFMQGTQASMGFVPEAQTDFIFTVLAEQFGFLGSIILLGLYAALLFSALRIGRSATDLYGTLIVVSAVGMWIFQILENIGMDMGLMPITGIPLPFMSYGTSFMLVNFMLLGLIWSVYARRGRQKT